MGAIVKEGWEIDLMREAGKIVARGLSMLTERAVPGATTADLDRAFEEHVRSCDAVPTFKGYREFPASICASLNEEVVHGIPTNDRRLKKGDVLKIDAGATYRGYVGDSAVTLAIGTVPDDAKKLIEATRQGLEEGIKAVKPGATLGDLGAAIQRVALRAGYGVVRKFCGHGIGRNMHEEPNVPNFVTGEPYVDRFVLRPGHCIAIEPMFVVGNGDVTVLPDNWTVINKGRGLAAHWEHTVAVTDNGCEVLTRREGEV